jgi:hypothetical protein
MIGFGRHTLFGMAVLAATGVPYALSNLAEKPGHATEPVEPGSSPATEQPLSSGSAPMQPAQPIADLAPPPSQPLEGPQVVDLAEVFRFDVSPSWLTQRWPRVMSSRHEGGLLGYRVLLVTGTKESDLAGPLTYYFDTAQQVQRIRFQGTTGDFRPLVRHLTNQFGMVRQQSNNPAEQLYEIRRDGRLASQLRIVTASILDAATPTAHFQVELTLARPSDSRLFSEAPAALRGIRWP